MKDCDPPEPPHNLCGWCREPVDLENDNHPAYREAMHYECGIRLMVGSVAHLEGRCSCYVPGATETDPPGMTLREAAVAAFQRFNKPAQQC